MDRDLVQWYVHAAAHAFAWEVKPGIAIQVAGEGLFDQAGPETSPPGRRHRWTAPLSPFDVQPARPGYAPSNQHLAAGHRESTVFDSVGRKFMKGHAQRYRRHRSKFEVIAIQHESAAIRAGIGGQFLCEDVAQAGARPEGPV